MPKARTKREDGIQHHPGAKDEQFLQITFTNWDMRQKLANHPGVLIAPPLTLKQRLTHHVKTQLSKIAKTTVKHPTARSARLFHKVTAFVNIHGISTFTKCPGGHDAIDATANNGDAFGFRFRCWHRYSHYPMTNVALIVHIFADQAGPSDYHRDPEKR